MSNGMGGGGGLPADWTKAIIVPVYKGKGRKGVCCVIVNIYQKVNFS